MSERSNYFLIEDIQESASRILTYTSDMTFDQFTSDQKTIDAVIRNFEIIGEAANRIANDFKEKFSDIPWRRLSDFRNRLIREYFGVDLHIVWNIIQYELADMAARLEKIQPDPNDTDNL